MYNKINTFILFVSVFSASASVVPQKHPVHAALLQGALDVCGYTRGSLPQYRCGHLHSKPGTNGAIDYGKVLVAFHS
jgi:hypothetical protein